jgi:hypothetical protein
MTLPVRSLLGKAAQLKYDEIDHFLAMSDVQIPYSSQKYAVLYKNDPDHARTMTNDEFYGYEYARTKAFSDWIGEEFKSLKELSKKEVQDKVKAKLYDIKKSAIGEIEDGVTEPEKIYQAIK